jgi:hypothetical protein
MRNMILAGLALTALAAAPAAAAPAPALMLDAEAPVLAAAKSAAQSGGVRVWVDNHRDYFRYSDRLRVRVRSEHDGYLAVFHIDTNGDVDILYPRSEHDDGWVERGRTLTLGSRGRNDYLNVRGGNGVGYVMAVALDEPLELWRVRDLYRPRFAGWDADRSIYGDPFYAMDEIVRAVVPESSYGYESVDYYTYHMGGRYDYPRYACYDGYGDWYNDSRYSYYGHSRCDRVRVILINRPWYYDTYRWRGSRRVYYDRYYYRTARSRPLHGYKERTQSYAPPARSSTAQRRPGSSGDGNTPAARGGVSSARPESTRPAREGTVSARRPERDSGTPAAVRRPETTERAAPASRPERGTYEPRVRDRGEGRGAGEPRTSGRPDRATSQPRQPDQSAQPPQQDKPVEPARERPTFQRRPERSAEPRRESPPARSAEPRRESPPARSAEPRRESPPARSAEPRRESPPARSAEPRRESAPARSSEPSRSRDSGSGSRGGGSGSRGTRPN